MKFKQIINILALLLLGVINMACAEQSTLSETPAATKKVLLIGLDGIRVDILAKAHTPHIDALIAQGAYSDNAYTRMPTISGPGWSSIVTGVWADKHGVNFYDVNDFSNNDFATYPDFLTRIERANPAINTLAIVVWPPLGNTTDGGPVLSDAIDVKVNINGDGVGYERADSLAVVAAVAQLANADPDAAFVYFGNTDILGHDKGSLSPEYQASIEAADKHVGALVAAVKQRPTYAEEDWLILLSTDHGRADDGSHGHDSAKEHRIYYLASGPSSTKGTPATTATNVDFVPTALTHLGVAIDPSWGLDGKVVGLKVEK